MSSELPRGRTEFPLLPLKNVVVFPRTLVTLTVGRTRSIRALEEALNRDRRMVVATQRAGQADEPSADEIYGVGTLVEINQVQRQNDGNLQVNVEGLRRVRVERFTQHEPFFTVQTSDVAEKMADGPAVEALMRHLVELFNRYGQLNNKVASDAVETVRAWHAAGHYIHVTSHRAGGCHAATAAWLERISLPFDDLYCSYDKVSRCVELEIDVLVDDSPINIRRALEQGIVAATLVHPWNEDVCEEEPVIAAKDWPELARKLEPVLSGVRRVA